MTQSDPNTDLSALTEALGDPDIDLDEVVAELFVSIHRSVSSLLSLSVTVTVDKRPITVSSPDPPPPDVPRAFARIPITPTASLALFAFTAGAFVDFAADAAAQLGIALTAVDVDTPHRPDDHAAAAVVATLGDYALANQAIGVLIEAGFTIGSADLEIQRLAYAESTSAGVIAQRILDAATKRGRDGVGS